MLSEVARAHRSVLGIIEPRRHFVVRREEERGEGNVSDDRGEQVVEIVRDATGEQTELLERFGLAAFCFTALTFGDVAKDENDAADFVFSRESGRRPVR